MYGRLAAGQKKGGRKNEVTVRRDSTVLSFKIHGRTCVHKFVPFYFGCKGIEGRWSLKETRERGDNKFCATKEGRGHYTRGYRDLQ